MNMAKLSLMSYISFDLLRSYRKYIKLSFLNSILFNLIILFYFRCQANTTRLEIKIRNFIQKYVE